MSSEPVPKVPPSARGRANGREARSDGDDVYGEYDEESRRSIAAVQPVEARRDFWDRLSGTRAGSIAFVLPQGFLDRTGALHREGVLRPATALDELRALGDFRVHLWPETFSAVILARLVLRLGSLERVDAGVIQRLDPADREHLERLYRETNGYPTE